MTDPNIPDSDAQLDETLSTVNERIIKRLHEINRRIDKTKHAMNVAEMIRTHPLVAAGVSLAVGALFGLVARRAPALG